MMTKYYPVIDAPSRDYRAKLIGEFRPPRKGEWYISGSIPEAYLAPNDLSTPFHIAKLVKIRRIEVYEEI